MIESVLSFTIERLRDPLIEEAKFFHGVSDQIKQLEDELETMRCFLRDADDTTYTVKNLISEVRNLAYEAENVIEIYAVEISVSDNAWALFCNVLAPFYKPILVHNLGRNIKYINSQMFNLTRSFHPYYGLITRDHEESIIAFEKQREMRCSYSHVVNKFIVGLDLDKKKVVEWLLNQDHHSRMVYICGMSGLGKTTLAKSVYYCNSIRSSFECFAWVYISQQCNKREVWKKILLQLITSYSKEERDKVRKMTHEELAEMLYKFQQQKVCLIILDDIWSNETWDLLSPAFPSENSKSKIIFTSRNKAISSHVDPKGLLHELGFLNAEDSWALFRHEAFPTKAYPEFKMCKEFEILGKHMVTKCFGLPFAITALGGLLASKETLSEWETIHRYINSYLMNGEVHEMRLRLIEVLDLSYNDLPCQLKPCFLYLSRFPEDFEIPKSKLIQLWIAEGFVSSQYEIERDETMEDVAELYLGSLISRCMVQIGKIGSTGKVKTCRLHGLMRDMCLSKARKEHFFYVIDGSQPNNSINDAKEVGGVRRLALFLDKQVDQLVPSNEQINQHLRSVYFHDKNSRVKSWKSLQCVFKNFKLLRVLDIEGVKVSEGETVLGEVGNLLWLKFLSLKGTNIQILPTSLGKLENLQSLNLQTINKVNCYSRVEIPNIIWKLKQLRHLYLPKWCGKVSLQLGNLSKLQTLINFPARTCDLKDLLQLTRLKKLLLNDPRYFQNFVESFDLYGKKLEFLESLSLKSDLLLLPNEVIDIEKLFRGCPSLFKLHVEGIIEMLPQAQLFPPQLSKLTLWGCKFVEDPMVILESLPNLKYLSCWKMFVGKKMVCSSNGFPKLEVLVIRGFSNLEEWVVEDQAMSCLHSLSISDCYKLKSVPDGLKFVAGLRELEIKGMLKSFKDRIGFAGEDYHKIQHVSSIVFVN